jgi:outer membrane receptor protein involved in Fe transport
VRRESDHLPENRDLSMPGNDKNRSNDETRLDVKHEWTLGSLLSEARLGYEDYTWNPHSSATTPFFKYRVANGSPQLLNNSGDVAFAGGSPDAQKRGQKGSSLSEDLTYTGLKGHVVKGGVRLKAMKYDLSGTARAVDVVETLLDTTTGLPYFSGGLCTGTNITNTGLNSDQCRIDKAIPSAITAYSNNQFGIYIQDDWAITRQVELNAGVRWDVESNMLNNDYATPADRVTALKALDGRNVAGIQAPAGQTYAQSLAKGGINIDDYISTGNSRKTYKGAIAPRLGASYDVLGDRATVVYGGWGRSYSRTMANHAMDERQKNAQPGGEIWLIRNEFKMPYADQFSLGLRQAVGTWNGEVALSQVNAKNQFIWFGGNRDPNGGWGTQSPIDPLWGGPNGFGTLILGDFVGETKTTSMFVSAAKPYTRESGWSANIAYTYSDAKTTSKEWNNDIFDWTYGRNAVRGWNPSTLVAKHRIVAAGLTDSLLPWGMSLSAKLTWDDGLPRRITSCAAGWDKCISVKGDAPSFMQVDVSLGKDFGLWGQKITLRADVLNLFDKTNYGGFDDWGGGPGNPQNAVGGDNANLGKPNSTRGDTRTLRLMLGYKF